MSIFSDNITNKIILEDLVELKKSADLFNQMLGSPYKSNVADEINKILYRLEHEGVEVDWRQPHGVLIFNNLDILINEYSNGNL